MDLGVNMARQIGINKVLICSIPCMNTYEWITEVNGIKTIEQIPQYLYDALNKFEDEREK